jgi:DNA-binding PadR family transcriptional regulator
MGRGEYLGEFEQVVLLAVARLEEEAYGMRVREEIEVRAGRRTSIGAVYATLERLVSKGYARETEMPGGAERSGLARRFYEITPAGKGALEEVRELQARMWSGLKLRPGGRRS